MKLRILSILLFILFLFPVSTEGKDWRDYYYSEPVTLSLLVSSESDQNAFQAAAELIEEKLNIHTEIRMRSHDIEGENYFKSLLTMGEMTDLCTYYSGAQFRSLNPQVYFVDLSQEPFAENIEEIFSDAVSVDGVLYGIPVGTSYVGGWLYNIELHEKLGLKIPKTWDELMGNCEYIKQKGMTPIIAGYKDRWVSQITFLADWHSFLHNNLGTDKYNDTGSVAVFDDFSKLYELSARGLLPADAVNTNYDEACRLFAEGKAVYMPMFTTAIPFMDSLIPGTAEKIGVFGIPGDDENYQGITVWLPDGIYINKTSSKIDVAKLWMDFFLSDECQQVFLQHKGVFGISVIKNSRPHNPLYPYLRSINEYEARGATALASEFTTLIKAHDLPKITQECGLGYITPDVAAQRYKQDIQQLSMMLQLFASIK